MRPSVYIYIYIQTLPYFSQKSAQNSLQYPQPNPSFEQQRTVRETRKPRKSKTMPESVLFLVRCQIHTNSKNTTSRTTIKGIQKETCNLLQQDFFVCLWPGTKKQTRARSATLSESFLRFLEIKYSQVNTCSGCFLKVSMGKGAANANQLHLQSHPLPKSLASSTIYSSFPTALQGWHGLTGLES